MNKVVYEHIDKSGEVFYVGCGSVKRAYNKNGRNDKWKIASEKGYTINIVGNFPTEQALEKEFELIKQYGLKNLTNVRSGGQTPRPVIESVTKLVNFPDELFERLEKEATKNRRPTTTEIVIAVENHLKNKN